jgi:hypothetical protein
VSEYCGAARTVQCATSDAIHAEKPCEMAGGMNAQQRSAALLCSALLWAALLR